MLEVILILNAGSSSIKFSLFEYNRNLTCLYQGLIEKLTDLPCLTIFDKNHKQILKKEISLKGSEASLRGLLDWFESLSDQMSLKAVGHRVVHGGKYFFHPTIVTEDVMKKIESLIPLAPFHQPQSLEAIRIVSSIYPDIIQVACFDTTFHHTQEKLATLFAIPRSLTDEGLVRYGFHGISYEYISTVITDYIAEIGNKRVIVAHLGNGASMCAMYQLKSVATSMGLTALDGLMMGTRCGTVDPGLLLYLMQEKKFTTDQLEHLLYNESGLLGVSNISNDLRELLINNDANAQEAIELFCYRAAVEFGSLMVPLQGCDALVFTGGIGENAPIIRRKICERLSWLGIQLDVEANSQNSIIINTETSKLKVCVIPTNEESMLAKHTHAILEN